MHGQDMSSDRWHLTGCSHHWIQECWPECRIIVYASTIRRSIAYWRQTERTQESSRPYMKRFGKGYTHGHGYQWCKQTKCGQHSPRMHRSMDFGSFQQTANRAQHHSSWFIVMIYLYLLGLSKFCIVYTVVSCTRLCWKLVMQSCLKRFLLG